MQTVTLAMVRSYWKGRAEPVVRREFGGQLKAAWAIIVLLGAGAFALITAVLIAWPALAFLAAKLFG